MKVFVADRSFKFCQRLEHMLSELPNVKIIGSTQDPRAALQRIRELRPDVAILDVHLFGGKGLDLVKILKQERSTSFIMMLAFDASDQYRSTWIKSGADCLLFKPHAQQSARDILQALVDRPNPFQE